MRRKTVYLAVLSISIMFFQIGCSTLTTGQTSSTKDSSVAVEKLVQTPRSWNGQTLPTYPQGQPEVTILRITIPPGVRLDIHEHPVINAGVMISGQLTVHTLNDQTLHIEAGDPIVEVVDTWHYGINEGRAPAEIIVFYAGVVDRPITVQKKQKHHE